jgi:hypothetical protein
MGPDVLDFTHAQSTNGRLKQQKPPDGKDLPAAVLGT